MRGCVRGWRRKGQRRRQATTLWTGRGPNIRFACGDNGKRMQSELVEFIRGLAADAERWSELCRQIDADEIPDGIFEDAKHMGAGALEMHIDDAREARNG